MTTERDLLKQISAWIQKTPEHEVRSALAKEGVGDTTIRDLLKGTYDGRPRSMLKAAMVRVLEASKAS